MAKYERVTSTYTPTLHAVNLTKWQVDSAANLAPSSSKMDAEFNKIFDAVNEIWELDGSGTFTDISDAIDQVATNTSSIAALVAGMVPDADYGDITVSGTGTVWTIDNNAVTLAKIADANVSFAKLETDFISDATDTVITANDLILFGDADDSNNSKRDTVQGILDLTTGWELIETQTISGTPTSVDFTTSIDTTYDAIKLEFADIKLTTDSGGVTLRVSTDGGSSWVSTSSYSSHLNLQDFSTATYGGTTAFGTSLLLTGNNAIGNDTGEGFCGEVIMRGYNSTVLPTNFQINCFYVNYSGTNIMSIGWGDYDATTVVNGIQALAGPTAGTSTFASGTIHIYGLAK